MTPRLLLTATGFLCLSWSSVAFAQSPLTETEASVPSQFIDPTFLEEEKRTIKEQLLPTSVLSGSSPNSMQQSVKLSVYLGGESHSGSTQPLSPIPESLPTENTAESQSFAQVLPDPPSLPPGTIEPTRPELPSLPSLPEDPNPVPSLETPQPTPDAPSPALGVKVKVQRVEVLGGTVFSPAELEAAVAPFIGKEASFEDLLAIRTAITDLYTRNGYTTSGAFLPPQDLTEGVVKIQVVEGALQRIEIQGLNRLRESYVRDRIGLAAKPPINLRQLEEALQLLQLDPLLGSVQAELTAGTAPGLSVLTLNLKEAPPITAAFLFENRDSPSVGELRGTAALSHNNLLGFGDRITAEVGITEGIESYNFSYEIPLNPRDGTLSLRYNKNNSEIIEDPFAPLEILGDAETFSIGFRQPIKRTPNSEFALSLSGDFRRSQTYLLEDIPFSFSEGPEEGLSKVTAIRFSQEWTNRSRTRVLAARSQFSLGIGALGATVNDTGTDGRFFSWVGQFQYVQAFGRDNILIARLGTQLTPDSLLPLEQFSVGGVDTVRGYRQNQRVADNGVIASVEARFPIIRDPEGIGIIQLTPFFDFGTVWNNKGDIASPSTLASIGLGLRWQFADEWLARLDFGLPLSSIDNEGDSLQDQGIHFSIRFQPSFR